MVRIITVFPKNAPGKMTTGPINSGILCLVKADKWRVVNIPRSWNQSWCRYCFISSTTLYLLFRRSFPVTEEIHGSIQWRIFLAACFLFHPSAVATLSASPPSLCFSSISLCFSSLSLLLLPLSLLLLPLSASPPSLCFSSLSLGLWQYMKLSVWLHNS